MSDNSPISIIKLTLPMFIGSTLNWLLFGILIVQVYIYFSAFPKDPALSKYIVVTVVVLEVVETLSSAHDMIHTFGTGWGSMEALDDVGWAWFSVPVMGAVVACVGQLFFARRILIFSHNKYVTVLIIILAILQLGAGIWTGVIISLAKRFSLLQFDNLVATATWLAATAACDLVIVFGTVFYLAKSRRPEFKKTNGVISRIIMITVETGLLCALLAIFDLYLFVTYKGTNYHLALCIELSKVYSNSILMIMNSRAHMGHTPPTEISHHIHFSDMVFDRGTIPLALSRVDTGHSTHESTQHHDDVERK